MNLLELILGGMFSLIVGSYGYVYLSVSKLWKAIDSIRNNDIKHIKSRLETIEQERFYPPHREKC